MVIDSISNGIVIDHITSGKSMILYRYLNLEKLTCSVAIIKNAPSAKNGKKDIIKDGVIVKKFQPELPERLVGVIKCKNPRSISQEEQELTHIFKLTDREKRIYRCIYCESKAPTNTN